MKKFTIVTTQLVCFWVVVAVIQLSDAKKNSTMKIPLIKQRNMSNPRRKRDMTSVPLKSVDDDFFYGWIKCGTPGQELRVIFDTGSSDTWVMSALLCQEDSEICGSCGHRTYDNLKSSTSRNTGRPWSVSYQDGSTFDGVWCQDVLEVGGIRITEQEFAIATYGEQQNSCSPFDGIFGLGYHSTFVETCVFRHMMNDGLVDSGIFSFYLDRECGDNSVLILGDYDSQYYEGDVIYTDVVDDNTWLIQFSSVRIGDTQVMGLCEALIDSGTSLILGPPNFIDAFNALVGDPDQLDCPDVDGLPDITFVMKTGHELVITPEDYMLQEPATEDYDEECMCGIASSYQDQFIMGNVFMCKYYSVFNMEEGLVGFALAKNC